MRYENEPCIGCGQALRPETDDVVVCPDCGAPLHRHCWNEAGACPYAVRHGAGFAWAPTAAPPEPGPAQAQAGEGEPLGIICPTCGENCPPGALGCDNCGTDFEEFTAALRVRFEQEQLRREQYMREHFPTYSVNGRDVTIGDTLAGQPVEEIALQLRGPRRAVARYLARFEKNERLGWNWAAFLTGIFGPYWFFFRKLYRPALLLAALWLAATLAFLPAANAMFARLGPLAEQVTLAAQGEAADAAYDAFARELAAVRHQYRWHLAAMGASILAMAVASGLLADPLLRRKLLENIAYTRGEGVTADGPGQRFGRHQLLIRLGGFSLVAPVLYFWASCLLPGMIIDAITWITK
ncbi:MAG: DUF2628 domain-containing protein [Oscillospiraceae bacterium]|jgi:hypothetical protein|nr:DUF2628 domain-containing protein [Oscillospiraceae bacterium]